MLIIGEPLNIVRLTQNLTWCSLWFYETRAPWL